MHDIPSAVAVDGDVGSSVTVVIARHGFIRVQAPLNCLKNIVRTSQDIPNAARGNLPENGKVSASVAIVIAGNNFVSVCAIKTALVCKADFARNFRLDGRSAVRCPAVDVKHTRRPGKISRAGVRVNSVDCAEHAPRGVKDSDVVSL